MNSEPNQSSPPVKASGLRRSVARLWHILSHNWGWKLLCVFLAVCLWAGLITQDPTLTRERTFTDVPVTVIGADSLRRGGMIVVSGIEDENLNVRLRADVPQREYNTVVASNYNPRINLAGITEVGEQRVDVLTTSTTTYGIVEDVSPAQMTLLVDQYVTNYRVPVSVNPIGDYPAGFYGATPSLTPSLVAVSGPASVVNQIARILVDFDLTQLEAKTGLVRVARAMRFVDENGVDVDRSLLEVTSSGVVLRTIIIEQQLYATKTLAVADVAHTTGEPAEGYEVRSVTATPATLLGAGEESKLDALDALFVDNPISLTGATASFAVEVKLRKPVDLVYISPDSVTLYVEIVPKIISRTFDDIRIDVVGTPAVGSAKLSQRYAAVSVTGPQLLLQSMKASAITATVEVEGLTPGDYETPISVMVSDVAYSTDMFAVAAPSAVRVTVTEK